MNMDEQSTILLTCVSAYPAVLTISPASLMSGMLYNNTNPRTSIDTSDTEKDKPNIGVHMCLIKSNRVSVSILFSANIEKQL